jgi:hypothetical protein
VLKFEEMPKDTRLTFRVGSDLKNALESVSKKEARSVAQICEAMLEEGLSVYQKEGAKYFQRIISSRKEKGRV